MSIDYSSCNTGIDYLNVIYANGVPALAALYRDQALHAKCKQALDALPTFKEAGDYHGVVSYIGMEPSQWDNEPGVMYLVMYLFDTEARMGDWWRGSTSPAYMTGNNSDKTYVQQTLRQLEKVGAAVQNGQWGSLVAQLLNRKIPFWVNEVEAKSGRKFLKIQSLGERRKVPEAVLLPGFDFAAAYPQPAAQPVAQPAMQPAQQAPAAYPQAAPVQLAAPAPQYQQQQLPPNYGYAQQAANAFGPAPQVPQQGGSFA